MHEEKQPESNIFGTSMLHNFYDKVSKNKQTADVSDIVSEGWTWDIGNFTRQNHPLQLMVMQASQLYLHMIQCTIKHRVQNPRRVTKTKPIASTHAQMCPRILVGVSIAR